MPRVLERWSTFLEVAHLVPASLRGEIAFWKLLFAESFPVSVADTHYIAHHLPHLTLRVTAELQYLVTGNRSKTGWVWE